MVTGQREVRRAIGYVGQGNGAGHQQRGRDELVSQGRAHGLSRADARRRAGELIDELDLTAVADRKVSTLSGGQRRRLDIAMGLVHLPRVLFLDEPSTGLDPQNRANLQEQIRRLHEETGSTIVLTTHYLEEADALAGRVIVVDHGLVIADDSAARLKSGLGDLVTLGFDRIDHAVARGRAGRRPLRPHGVRRSRRRPGDHPRERWLAGRAGAGRGPGRGGHPGPADRGQAADARRRVPEPDRPQPARDRGRGHPERDRQPTTETEEVAA